MKHEFPNPLRILHLEDSIPDQKLVVRVLEKAGWPCEVVAVDQLDAFAQVLETQDIDLILADYKLPGFTAMEAWQTLQQRTDVPPFILLSGAIGESAAVEAIKMGLSDYLDKADLAQLPRVIERSIDMHQAHQAKARADAQLAHSEKRLGEFADHLQSTIERERASIAREIHDDIGGSLAAVRHDLFWLERRIHDPDAQAHIKAASAMLQHAMEASQRIMMNLRPAILDQGLVAALEWLCHGFERRTGIMVQFTAKLLSELNKDIELTAYRTAQEALTNISKHAQCSHVTVDLTDFEQCLTLEVADNGQGLTPQDRQKSKSFGLQGLEERARSVGGWLDISVMPGRGTAIILSIPLNSSPRLQT